MIGVRERRVHLPTRRDRASNSSQSSSSSSVFLSSFIRFDCNVYCIFSFYSVSLYIVTIWRALELIFVSIPFHFSFHLSRSLVTLLSRVENVFIYLFSSSSDCCSFFFWLLGCQDCCWKTSAENWNSIGAWTAQAKAIIHSFTNALFRRCFAHFYRCSIVLSIISCCVNRLWQCFK